MVLDGVDQSPNQVQPEATGGALLDWQADVRVGRLRGIELLDLVVGQGRLDPAVDPGQVEPDRGSALPAVLDHIGEELFDREIDRIEVIPVDSEPGERSGGELEDLLQRLDPALE